MNEFGLLIQAHIPALMMMIAGFCLLVVEMYVPGFGLPGITGTILMVAGIVIMKPTPLQGLVLVLISIILLSIAFSIAMHSISKGRLSRSKLVLNEALNQSEPASGEDLSYFVGRVGLTHTTLRPAGIAEFDGVKLNVTSDGDYIGSQQYVRVERAEGNRIVVRKSDKDGHLL